MARLVASSRLFIVAFFVMTALYPSQFVARAQGTPGPSIASPSEGQVLQGQVLVTGTTDIPGYSSTELSFAYAQDPTGTWFLIQSAGLPATDAQVGLWDTTAISDGDYQLRLRVILQDGSFQDATVGVHIRNYTLAATATSASTPTARPAVQVPTAMIIVASDTPTQSAPPAVATRSALPPNPAGVTATEVYSGFWRGALIVGLLILAFGALVLLRRH